MLYAYLYILLYMCTVYIIGGNVVRLTQRDTPAGVAGVGSIPGLVTSAAYTTKSVLLFVVQVLIRSLLVCTCLIVIMELP